MNPNWVLSKKYFAIVLILFAFYSCDDGNVGVVFTPSSGTLVTFNTQTAESNSQVAASFIDTSVLDPNEIIVIELTASGAGDIQRVSYVDGENTLTLTKGEISLVGFVYNPNLDTTPQTEGIVVVGVLAIPSARLTSIPLSGNAGNRIELGNLTRNGHYFDSGVPIETIIQGSGHEMSYLLAVGFYDETIEKFLNPDIDRNGVYDWEEDKWWLLTGAYNLYESDFGYDFDTGSFAITPTDISHDVFCYFVSIMPDMTDQPDYLLVDMTISSDLLGSDETISASNGNGDSGGGYQFHYSEIGGISTPIDGDYLLDMSGDEYYFQNIRFYKPANDFEGFIFPVSRYKSTDGSSLSGFEWDWKIVKDGAFVNASEWEVEARITYVVLSIWKSTGRHVYISYSDSDYWSYDERDNDDVETNNQDVSGPSVNIGGVLDVALTNLALSDVSSFEFGFRESSGNFYSFHSTPD